MRKWLLLAGMILAVGIFGHIDHTGTDVSYLEPVKLIYLDSKNGEIIIATDTGSLGKGKTVASAIAQLKAGAKGKIFLETAEHLLVTPEAQEAVRRLMPYLRPDCSLTVAVGMPDLLLAADFLSVHKPGFTLNDLRAGESGAPILHTQEERMRLENR